MVNSIGLTGGSAAGVVQRATPDVVTGTVELADGQFYGFRTEIPNGKAVRITGAGAIDDNESSPNGLKAVVRDTTFGTTYTLSNGQTRATGSPLEEISGETILFWRVQNDSGGTLNANAYFEYTYVDD